MWASRASGTSEPQYQSLVPSTIGVNLSGHHKHHLTVKYKLIRMPLGFMGLTIDGLASKMGDRNRNISLLSPCFELMGKILTIE